MTETFTSQLHGYKHGHQLLSSSAKISKGDQAVIDRLSDVAGPLRPGEAFDPYLTAYPLPSGEFFVLARTWQDLSVPRAGCVRTLSLVIPIETWSSSPTLNDFLASLALSEMPMTATSGTVTHARHTPLPSVSDFAGNELLEAIFLEEAKPVAIFDAPEPELITVRLLTALWPTMRKRFAVCTFALSPRKIEGRSFDLVFAPKDARSRFAKWEGRRIDAKGGTSTRHRWTRSIIDRVFHEPIPKLLSDQELRLVGSEDSGSSSALRIVLLWEELHQNLERTPSAALGLLDIANSRSGADPGVIASLQPAIAEAAHRAVSTFPATEAWEFIGALTKKMRGSAFASALPAIGDAAGDLAAKSPAGAIALVEQPDAQGALSAIVPQIANGLRVGFGDATEHALIQAHPMALSRLLSSSVDLAATLASSAPMIRRIAEILPQLPPDSFDAVKEALLPALVQDFQREAFLPLVASLSTEELLEEARHLAAVSMFAAESFIPVLSNRAHELGADRRLRDLLVTFDASQGRDQLLAAGLEPTEEDVDWLLDEQSIGPKLKEHLFLELLRRATTNEFASLFRNDHSAEEFVRSIPDSASDILLRAAGEIWLPLSVHLDVVSRLLPMVSKHQARDLLWRVIERCLREESLENGPTTIAHLLDLLGEKLDGSRLAKAGLGQDLPPRLFNRNMVAFGATAEKARNRLLHAIDDIARVLSERYSLDMDRGAGIACAQLFSDAESLDRGSHLRASGRLLPTLLRSGGSPVSPVIAATFPAVYRELAKEDDVPDLLRFIPFFDWDRCKSARRELVDAFLRSRTWSPGDLALTAFLAGDLQRLLRRVAKDDEGGQYIKRLSHEIPRLPLHARSDITRAVSNLYEDWPAKYDWRD
ncbi:hypothetical protein J8N08_22905 (plasmid) [Agrobacterium tumefaciens]|nr:hypothetical protein J8N08_22905 [Agrobacterium tumefaciens]